MKRLPGGGGPGIRGAATRMARSLAAAVRRSAHLAYHILIVSVSAGFALSLPAITDFLARNFLSYWALIQDEKLFLVSIEIGVAVLLILVLNSMGGSWRDRRFATVAKRAGILEATTGGGFFARRRIKRLKEQRGVGRDLLLIGSTGFRTFVNPDGDLRSVLLNCREAKIMLLDPESEGARTRAKSISNTEVTEEKIREQIRKSIEFLKGLKEIQKNVRLKLYQDPPFLKLAIVGDYIWMQHYHGGMDVQRMPEYIFKHTQNPGSLYVPLYQYFLDRWNDPSIPEYDFETDELVYSRDSSGGEGGRESFVRSRAETQTAACV